MPAPEQNLLVTPRTATITVALEPAFSAIHSLMLLYKAEHLSGLGEWVVETREAMSAEEAERHKLVVSGLYYAIQPGRSYPSFPAYVDHLASMPAVRLRNRVLDAYARIPVNGGGECLDSDETTPAIDIEAVLASAESFLDFLRVRFEDKHLDEEVEKEAYRYLNDPPALQEVIVAHLRHMWDKYLEAEWERVKPMLGDAVAAFNQIDLSAMGPLEAARFVTGRPLEESYWEEKLGQAERVVFVPSAHIGPYVGHFRSRNAMGILFGARLPEGVSAYAPDLSRTEIVVRLSALADDTRLRILKLVADEGEQRSQNIIERLGISQSAASRHLKQLSASGYLSERRCAGAKCYDLNPERIEDTLNAVAAFLLE